MLCLNIVHYFNVIQRLPWIPFEYHSNPNRARTDFKAEIWAYATTIWEIFSRGEMPLLQYVNFKYFQFW